MINATIIKTITYIKNKGYIIHFEIFKSLLIIHFTEHATLWHVYDDVTAVEAAQL